MKKKALTHFDKAGNAHMVDVGAKDITERVVRMVGDGEVISVTGKRMKMRMDTVCIHGDTPGAVEIAQVLRKGLADAGIAVAPFKRAG